MQRQLVFYQLKPACLELLQVTANLSQRPNARNDLIKALGDLNSTLNAVTAHPGALDAKLAEYVFVPISQVLRVSRTVPVRALELCLECISALLRTGWGASLTSELSGQLLILFTFMAKPSSAENGASGTSEELQVAAFKCITELSTEISRYPQSRQFFTATSNIPALGEAVLVTLDGLSESKSTEVQIHSVGAIRAIISAIEDRDALASFLPRIVSSLTKVLTPSSSGRVGFRVLEGSLSTITLLFLRILSDRETRQLPDTAPNDGSGKDNKVSRTISWLNATASQIKLALGNILKLRNHDKLEVRQALLRLCLAIVQECKAALSDCNSMAMETMITLAGHGGAGDAIENDLKGLLALDQGLSDILRESLHGWVVSLPRIMQSKDDTGRRQVIHQISVTLRLLNAEQTMIDDLLADNLRNGFSSILNDSKESKSVVEQSNKTHVPTNMALINVGSSSFEPIKLRLKGQDDMMAEFKLLLEEISKSPFATNIAQDLAQSVDSGSPDSQLASFWLSTNLLRDIMAHDSGINDFLDFGTPDTQAEILDDLYVHALDRLSPSDPDSGIHWHLQALSMEVIALQATRYKSDYRAELSEALYPVLHHLGSSNPSLRHHAITCLNIMADSCGYTSASELVVSNVDYIVNAVGLRLNYGDVSPQAPQVLLMMMRLCGPSLLPYLDDLVGSIFGALERYHGYPKLVELLFSVLRGMAEEGIKAPQLAITAQEETGEVTSLPKSFSGIIEVVEQFEAELGKNDDEHLELPEGSFPREPWKNSKEPVEEPTDADNEQPKAPEEPTPPAPRTFDLLLKISELTQHYLTSSSPSLRTSLLSLLHTTIPALALHENSFLPLINTLWPVLFPRLKDPEAYIVANSLDIIALMCEHAGNFMKSRIEVAWSDIKALHRRIKMRTDERGNRSNPGSKGINFLQAQLGNSPANPGVEIDAFRPEAYVDAPTRMMWDSLVKLLIYIAQYVGVREDYFDEILDVLDPVLGREDVLKALNHRNADAVWLRLYKKQKLAVGQKSGLIEKVRSLNEIPAEKGHWKFAGV
ncbi:hypothetical protein BS50DRAFT_615625 [Corynespora cassiicola Philippines]|uniref:ARM repeat-containing protein n=1 Tax=Corynespora cassiicola Philippines TaxID=1448308 RepID=A0A2T2PAX4_CORCC|nr:hypothetical protein BS50DRAFT_615625 [Corynespora cassiicola Philippines]